jgi:hypothetical protein
VVPAWEKDTVWPDTVSDPLLEVVEAAFDAVVTVTAPLPNPVAGDTVANDEPLAAFHEQFDPLVVMPIVPVPPPAANGLPSVEVSTLTEQASACSVIA